MSVCACRYSYGVVLWEAALLRKPYGDLAARVGAAGALFCTIMENYRQNIGLPMDDWPTAASEADGGGNSNVGAGAVALIGDDLKGLVEACLRLKHTKQTPRPTFEAIAAALGAMLQKLRHQANMERRQAERNSNQINASSARTRLVNGGGGIAVAAADGVGSPITPRRELSTDSDSPSLPASPVASQRGGVMAPLVPISLDTAAAGNGSSSSSSSGGGDGGAPSAAAAAAAPAASLPPPPQSASRPQAIHGGRRTVHTLRAAPGKWCHLPPLCFGSQIAFLSAVSSRRLTMVLPFLCWDRHTCGHSCPEWTFPDTASWQLTGTARCLCGLQLPCTHRC